MKVVRRLSVFFLTLAVIACSVMSFAYKPLAGLYERSGYPSSDELALTRADSDGSALLMYVRDAKNILYSIDSHSVCESVELGNLRDSDKYRISDFYRTSDGRLIIAYYEKNADGAVVSAGIAEAGKDMKLLYSENGSDSDIRFYSFSEYSSLVYIIAGKGIEYTLYQYDGKQLSVKDSVGLSGSIYTAIYDGQNMLFGAEAGELRVYCGGELYLGQTGRIFTSFMQSKDGVLFTDAAENELCALSYSLTSQDKDENTVGISFPDQSPVTFNGVLYVPVRFAAEATGHEIFFDNAGVKTVVDDRIVFNIGSDKATVDGSAVTLSDPVYIISDRTMVSNTVLEKYLSCTVKWKGDSWYLLSLDNPESGKNAEVVCAPLTLDDASDDLPITVFSALRSYACNLYGTAVMLDGTGNIYRFSDESAYEQLSLSSGGSLAAFKVLCAAIIVAALLVSAVAAYIYVDRRNRFIPLAYRKSVAVTFCVLIALNSVITYVILPEYEKRAVRIYEDEAISSALCAMTGEAAYRSGADNGYFELLSDGEVSRVGRNNLFIEPGSRSDTVGLTIRSDENGIWPNASLGDYITEKTSGISDKTLCAVINDASAKASVKELANKVYTAEFLLCALILVAVFAVMYRLARGLRMVEHGIDLAAGGNNGVEVIVNSGDEIETLATAFNGAVSYFRDKDEHMQRTCDSYLRFVPQQFVKLLGESSADVIGKQSHISRDMTVMAVVFNFSDDRYDHDTNGLFAAVNAVIERISPIISSGGGTVYSFGCGGIDCVFDTDYEKAASSAVAVMQAVDAANEERAAAGDNTVIARIALDTGSVMLGIVGDDNRFAPAAVSASFTAARHLTRIAELTDSRILCTEEMTAGLKKYKNRYIGRTPEGQRLLRIYEIYEGDAHDSLSAKDMYLSDFTDGIYAFYSGGYTEAKERFMSILKHQSSDGTAKYYLYLSDRYINTPPVSKVIGIGTEEY